MRVIGVAGDQKHEKPWTQKLRKTQKVLKDQNSGHTLEDTTTLYLYFVVQTDNTEQSDTLNITHYPTHYLFVGVDDVD